VRSPGWSLEAHVEQATRARRPDAEFVATLARVIAGAADLSELDKFERWRSA